MAVFITRIMLTCTYTAWCAFLYCVCAMRTIKSTKHNRTLSGNSMDRTRTHTPIKIHTREPDKQRVSEKPTERKRKWERWDSIVSNEWINHICEWMPFRDKYETNQHHSTFIQCALTKHIESPSPDPPATIVHHIVSLLFSGFYDLNPNANLMVIFAKNFSH